MNRTKDCNYLEQTAVTVCSRCGVPVCEGCRHIYNGEYICEHCRKKAGVVFSAGAVCLVGLILFVSVFIGVVVFGSKYAAGKSGMNEMDMNFESACLWLNEGDYTEQLPSEHPVAGNNHSGKASVELEKTLSDGTVVCLRPFINYAELQEFLSEDRTDEHIYNRDFDCDDFAFMLSQHAINRGYQIFPFAEENHLKNVAHVALGDSIIVYTIEPQTDEVRLWGKID